MRLRCIRGPFPSKVIALKPNEGLVFGRNPQEGDLRPIKLDSKSVSRTHCAILVNDQGFFIRDLQSSNGIRVNRMRVEEKQLLDQDQIEIGEFSFIVEEASEKSDTDAKPLEVSDGIAAQPRAEATSKSRIAAPPAAAQKPTVDPTKKILEHALNLIERFQKLDFDKRLLILLLAAGTFIHLLLVWPLISESRTQALRQSFETGRTATNHLAEKNTRELSERSFSLLDCEFLKKNSSVQKAFLLDARGRPVCPIGTDAAQEFLDDWLTDAALFRGETADDCEERILFGPKVDCDFVTPIRAWQQKEGQYQTVGIARVRYRPIDAENALEKLNSLGWRSLLLAWLIIVGAWWLIRKWLQRNMAEVAENVYLAASGAQMKVERSGSLSLMDPVIAEVNRMIQKLQQDQAPGAREAGDETGFFGPLLQQILLLEDRAVMVVDSDNQIIGMSRALSDVLALDDSALNRHVVDVIADQHLQGDLMNLLNDLSASEELIERPLSAADRVFHVRALPLFLKSEYAAGILIF